MPNEIRASTMKERAGDMLRSIFGSIAEQPLGQISDALGITDFTGLSEPQDPEALTLGIMPGSPGARFKAAMRDETRMYRNPKGFFQENYPHTQRVRVQWPNQEMADDIKGLNQGHAVYRARENWPGAEVSPVGDHFIDMSAEVPDFQLIKPTMPVQDPVVPRLKYRK